jgi:hypothetical protein
LPVFPISVRAKNQLIFSLFHESAAAGVVIGKNDQLYEQFYINEFCGRVLNPSLSNISQWGDSLHQIQSSLEKLGKKFPEKGITNLYYTYLKVAGTVEDALVIDAVFEQKVEYMTRLIEREKMKERFRQSQMEEQYSSESVYFDLDIKSSNSKKMHEKQILEDAEPMFNQEESKGDGKLNRIVLYVFIIMTVLLIGFFLAKTIFK